jgi:hypothetical protein
MLALVLAACEAQPTPFPVDLPSVPTSTPEPSIAAPIRYALDANTLGYVADIEMIEGSAQVEQLTEEINPNDFGNRYDIAAGYGVWSDWTRSPVIPHVALILNDNAPPLDSLLLANVVRLSVNAEAIVAELGIPGVVADESTASSVQTLRAELANQGYPDGLKLTLAYAYTPGVVQLAHQLRAAGIEVQAAPMVDADIQAALSEKWLHLALVAWTTEEQRATWAAQVGEENVVNLYILPISYRALPEFTITFTPSGWPIASH